MNKYLLIAILLVPMFVAAFWALLWSPAQTRIVEAREQTVQVEGRQEERRATIAELEDVRDNEETYLAEIASGNEFLPFDADLDSVIDQLHAAAEQAFVDLQILSIARPNIVDMTPRPPSLDAESDLVAYSMQFQVEGDYFSIVELVRLIEDSSAVPRAFVWSSASLTMIDEDQNLLSGSLSAELFAVVPTGGEEPEPEEEDGDNDADNSEDPLEVE